MYVGSTEICLLACLSIKRAKKCKIKIELSLDFQTLCSDFRLVWVQTGRRSIQQSAVIDRAGTPGVLGVCENQSISQVFPSFL